jgi:hypothetical protein
MRKTLSLLAVTALVLGSFVSVVSASAAAAPKVGSKCTKVGGFFDTPNTRFVCKKEGSKNVWRIWYPATAPQPKTTQPIPTPSPATATVAPKPVKPFVAPKPISLPVTQNGAITFANALERVADIPKTAWQRVQDVIASNAAPAPITNAVRVGPNTKLDITGGLPRIQEVLLRGQKLWSGFTQVSTFNLLMYNAQDEPWAEEDWKKTGAEKKYFPGVIAAQVKRIAGNCQATTSPGVFSGPPVNCRGADSSALENSDDAILTFGQGGDGAANDPSALGGGILAHEYTHSVQAAQWIGKPSSYCTEQTATSACNRSWSSNWGFSPCWLFEGLPNSVGPMVASESYESFQTSRKYLPYSQGPTTITDYSQASLLNFLVSQNHSTCYANGAIYVLGYTVGALTVETLVAIAGPQSVMALYSLGAEGQTFEAAFQNVYGMSWSEASVILSKVLAAQYATAGPPPK